MKHHRSIALPTIAVLILLAIPGCASWDVRSESARTPETHTQAPSGSEPAFELDSYRSAALANQPSLAAYRASVDAAQACDTQVLGRRSTAVIHDRAATGEPQARPAALRRRWRLC